MNGHTACSVPGESCGDYYLKNYPIYGYNSYKWFRPGAQVGYNNVSFTPVEFQKGTFISIDRIFSGLALETQNHQLFPDYFGDSGSFNRKINYTHNYRFYFNIQINTSYYQSTSYVTFNYPINTPLAQFNLSAKFAGSDTSVISSFIISNCNILSENLIAF